MKTNILRARHIPSDASKIYYGSNLPLVTDVVKVESYDDGILPAQVRVAVYKLNSSGFRSGNPAEIVYPVKVWTKPFPADETADINGIITSVDGAKLSCYVRESSGSSGGIATENPWIDRHRLWYSTPVADAADTYVAVALNERDVPLFSAAYVPDIDHGRSQLNFRNPFYQDANGELDIVLTIEAMVGSTMTSVGSFVWHNVFNSNPETIFISYDYAKNSMLQGMIFPRGWNTEPLKVNNIVYTSSTINPNHDIFAIDFGCHCYDDWRNWQDGMRNAFLSIFFRELPFLEDGAGVVPGLIGTDATAFSTTAAYNKQGEALRVETADRTAADASMLNALGQAVTSINTLNTRVTAVGDTADHADNAVEELRDEYTESTSELFSDVHDLSERVDALEESSSSSDSDSLYIRG